MYNLLFVERHMIEASILVDNFICRARITQNVCGIYTTRTSIRYDTEKDSSNLYFRRWLFKLCKQNEMHFPLNV